ncbi:aldo/keto reductase [Halomonas pacifica]|uniref:aldo/keto reductase n=1 Tax=Bisbaumannia pacifica TaxID=77098 RepID=UPI00235844AE|nr:aldo/keto reductase [Halomonas pacifica]MDC8802267.1 aldo/keto reductase [Halomonas pacifica]
MSAFEVPLVLGMMRLHEARELQPPERLADWIEARLDQGLDWFDHADIYGDGQGEALFGAALRRRPGLASRVRIVTKASIVTPQRDASGHAVKHYDASPAYLGAAIDAALARLGVERLDHFLLHRPDPLMDAEATGRALDDAVAAGKIAAAGVSNFLPEQWRRLQDAMHQRLAVHQLELSLRHSAPCFDGSYDALLRDGLTPLAWSPLGGGSVFEDRLGRVLTAEAESHGCSPGALALAWLRRLPGRPTPVVGTLKPERLDALRQAPELSPAAWYALLEAARSHRVA